MGKEPDKAVYGYAKASINGSVAAQTKPGLTYLTDNSSPENVQKGISWLKKAARQGEANAKKTPGLACLSGRGVPQNHFHACAISCHAASKTPIAAALCNELKTK